jgi:hypothetical protein
VTSFCEGRSAGRRMRRAPRRPLAGIFSCRQPAALARRIGSVRRSFPQAYNCTRLRVSV